MKPQSARDLIPFTETMRRHYATIEQALYAAYIKCQETGAEQKGWCSTCSFRNPDPGEDIHNCITPILHNYMPHEPVCIDNRGGLCISVVPCEFQRIKDDPKPTVTFPVQRVVCSREDLLVEFCENEERKEAEGLK